MRSGDEPADVLFIGMGASAVGWYRCYMPAMFMGADWIGVAGEPPKLSYLTGLVRGKTQLPNYFDYRVVVIQQPRGQGWFKLIKALQARGIKVIFEVDDYVHGIAKMEDHDFRQHFGREAMRSLELNMRACDGIICSTDFIARKYRSFNANVAVCRNGVDLGRYQLTRPPRPTVNIGWAGATGHAKAVLPWFQQVDRVMTAHANTAFVTIGQRFADAFKPRYGTRALSIPFTALEVYPAAMTMIDVALAPAGKGLFFRGKSDLRWIEAGALGIPTIADPAVYPDIQHGVDGFHAGEPEEVHELLEQLVDDPRLRFEVGDRARRYVLEERDMRVAVQSWVRVLNEAVDADLDPFASAVAASGAVA